MSMCRNNQIPISIVIIVKSVKRVWMNHVNYSNCWFQIMIFDSIAIFVVIILLFSVQEFWRIFSKIWPQLTWDLSNCYNSKYLNKHNVVEWAVVHIDFDKTLWALNIFPTWTFLSSSLMNGSSLHSMNCIFANVF